MNSNRALALLVGGVLLPAVSLSTYPEAVGEAIKMLIGRIGSFEKIPDMVLDTIEETHDAKAAVQLAEATKKRWPRFEKDWLFEDLDDAIGYVGATAIVVPGLLQRVIQEGSMAQMLKYSIPLYKAGKLDIDALDKIISAKINNSADVKLVSQFAKEAGATPNIAKHILTSKQAEFIITYCSAIGEALPGADEEILRIGTTSDVWRWMRFRRKYDWPAAEAILAEDERFTRLYTRATGRKPRRTGDESDPRPKTPIAALNFALATGDEYLEGEPLILQDLDAAIIYAERVVGPWTELEHKLKAEGTPEQKERYLTNVLYGMEPD